jgi:Zn-dependent M16 (insulinase) family peptidase
VGETALGGKADVGFLPGDESHGFVVQAVDVLDDYHGMGRAFKHRATGMEVYHVANDDPECVFGFIFKTPPLNDSGAPHIIEHSILAGSKRYPVKDPFMALLKGSVNTFMNAMTYPDFTVYPAASVLPKDFMNLFAVYSDAVFNPLLRQETFWQEGIRLVVDADGVPHFDGVVFNEMKGEMSDHDSIVARQSIRTLYPDTPYFFESGGTPEEIVRLDYRQFAAYYGTYYHPSNCRLFLYGSVAAQPLLALLDDHYLCGYSAISPAGPSPLAKPWARPKTAVVTSVADEGMDRHDATVTLSWATTLVEEPLQTLTLSILTDILLGNPGAPLYKAIIDSHLCKDVSDVSGMDTGFRQMPFTVGFKGIDPDDASKAQELVLQTLKELVVKGIDPKLVSNAVKRHEFSVRELSGDMPTGIKAMNRAMRGWLQGLQPHETIRVRKPLDEVKQAIAARREERQNLFPTGNSNHPALGYFEQWIQDHLLDNPHRCLLSIVPDVQHMVQQEQAIEKRLNEVLATMEKGAVELIKADTVRFETFQERRDEETDLATIPLLSRSDLPAEIRILNQTTAMLTDVPVLLQPMETNGIVYLDGMFAIDDLTEEEHLLIPLLTRMLHMTGIGAVPYDQVAVRVRELTGALYFYLECGSRLESERDSLSALVFRMKSLVSDTPAAGRLLSEILTDARLDDSERIVAVVNDLLSSFEANVTSSGQMYAAQRCSAVFSPIMAQNEQWNGLSQWFYLSQLDMDNPTVVAALGEHLVALRSKIIDRSRLTLHACASEDALDTATSSLAAVSAAIPCLGKLPDGNRADFPQSQHKIELFRLPASVGFTAMALRSAQPLEALQAHQSVLGQLLSTNHLWERVRGSGGAYGVSASNDMLERLFVFSSYRDPRIDGTLNDYLGVLEQVAREGVDAKVVEQAVISLVGRELKPLYPKEAAMMAFRRSMYGISDEFRSKRRAWILSTTSEDLKKAAEALLASARSCSSIAVLAGQEVLEREAAVASRLAIPSIRLPL